MCKMRMNHLNARKISKTNALIKGEAKRQGEGEEKLASILYGKQVRPGKFDGSPAGKQRERIKETKRVGERE